VTYPANTGAMSQRVAGSAPAGPAPDGGGVGGGDGATVVGVGFVAVVGDGDPRFFHFSAAVTLDVSYS